MSNSDDSSVKAAGLAGILVVVFATFIPDLKAAHLNNAVREGQSGVTELSSNPSAVSESDGWLMVTAVDTVIGQDGDAESRPWCVARRCYCLASPS
jgi:hypothetical protein